MIPKIFEYDKDSGNIQLTDNAFLIPEILTLYNYYPNDGWRPYVAYAYFMSAPDSPYIWTPENEKLETIVFDVRKTVGEFDYTCRLTEELVNKLKSLYTSTLVRRYDALKILIDKMSNYIKTAEIIEGRDGNLSELMRIVERAGNEMRSFRDLEKQVDEELADTRGGHELGEY